MVALNWTAELAAQLGLLKGTRQESAQEQAPAHTTAPIQETEPGLTQVDEGTMTHLSIATPLAAEQHCPVASGARYGLSTGYGHDGDTDSKAALQKKLGAKRAAFWKCLLSDTPPGLEFVFVSKHQAEALEATVGVRIPSNRSCANWRHADDLSTKAILELARDPFFDDLKFLLIGDGCPFEEVAAPLHAYPNAKIEPRFVEQREVSVIQRDDGGFLITPRLDSQRVSRDEAMCSGLVPVTNRAAVIPEFIKESYGILADPEDYVGVVQATKQLHEETELFLRLSAGAIERATKQCSSEQTVQSKLAIITQHDDVCPLTT